MVAAAAALMLAACGQGGSGAPLPPVRAGAQAPSTPIAPTGTVQQANITAEMRTSLTANVNQMLGQMQQQQGGEQRPAA